MNVKASRNNAYQLRLSWCTYLVTMATRFHQASIRDATQQTSASCAYPQLYSYRSSFRSASVQACEVCKRPTTTARKDYSVFKNRAVHVTYEAAISVRCDALYTRHTERGAAPKSYATSPSTGTLVYKRPQAVTPVVISLQ